MSCARVLHDIARRGHARLSYAAVWGALDFTTRTPTTPTTSSCSTPVGHIRNRTRSAACSTRITTTTPGTASTDSWNREHIWPKSHGFPGEGQLAHTDIHHLRPADVTCNSDRGNLDFDESDEAHPERASWRDADSFEPRDAVKGDIARMLFYMDVHYAGEDGVPDLELIDADGNSGPVLGHLCTLLAWHAADPVDDLERRRHQRIVQVQGNRNPFIDRPEFAAANLGQSVWRELGLIPVKIGLASPTSDHCRAE
jgi:endonuclease I